MASTVADVASEPAEATMPTRMATGSPFPDPCSATASRSHCERRNLDFRLPLSVLPSDGASVCSFLLGAAADYVHARIEVLEKLEKSEPVLDLPHAHMNNKMRDAGSNRAQLGRRQRRKVGRGERVK